MTPEARKALHEALDIAINYGARIALSVHETEFYEDTWRVRQALYGHTLSTRRFEISNGMKTVTDFRLDDRTRVSTIFDAAASNRSDTHGTNKHDTTVPYRMPVTTTAHQAPSTERRDSFDEHIEAHREFARSIEQRRPFIDRYPWQHDAGWD